MEFSATIISIDFLAAECFKMNNKGHLNLIYRRPLSDCEIPLLKATCCDVKYDPVKNETYILVGTETGQVYLREIDNISDQSETPKESYILYSEKTQILSIRFFEQQYSENSSNYHAVLTSTTLKFMCMNPNEDTFNATHLHSIKTGRSIDLSKIKNMLTLGDGEIVHDIWLISDTSAYLLIGRNQEYYPRKHVELQFSDWKGSITASCSLSTKKSVHEDYLDVIFVAKGPKIGILVVLHMEDDPANVIQFTDWKMTKGSDAIAIHTELLKEPPKFVIVSGSNGSQVVRICPNKQLYSKDLDKIVSSSSVDQEHLSDGE
ncbi:hypothetical protein PRIPAC_84497 [Pristionchus pacificus]|uniref:Uncharacterized protein n=1 Tax=Pristionchus pacificus TaxID=54126 RepID=A0A2A6BND1_PRIPA|nr:hypothetical protein PRIPAC_84497 [Pristionchus pacificus]|eukprot:PDM67409.1 hypothetical protein PRIPAC_48826 [Pristionchus pacificus]